MVGFSRSKSLDQNQRDSFGNWLISNLVSRGKQLNMRKEIHLVRVCKCGNIRPIKIGMTRDLSLQLEWEAGNSRARFSQQQKMYPQLHNTPRVLKRIRSWHNKAIPIICPNMANYRNTSGATYPGVPQAVAITPDSSILERPKSLIMILLSASGLEEKNRLNATSPRANSWA